MTTTHLKNLAVSTGTYQDQRGEQKKRWKTVGKLLRNDNGEFLVMDRTFNPAGLPGEGDVFISLFEPRPAQGQTGGASAPYGDPRDTDIPF
jgi:hypothetical protein